jgi:hypothetical protein
MENISYHINGDLENGIKLQASKNLTIMKKRGFIRRWVAAILSVAFISAPALDSFGCLNCQTSEPTPFQVNNRLQLPHAPSIVPYDNSQTDNHERDKAPCPFCFLNMFGLVNPSSFQTLFPSISFQTQALPILLSLHPSPIAKPPQI